MGSNFELVLLEYKEIIELFLPEIRSLSKEKLKKRLNAMKALNLLTLRLAVLLHEINATDKILMNLKYDNKTIKTVKILAENIDEKIYPDPVNVKKWLHKINYVNLSYLIKIKKELFNFEYDELVKTEKIMDEIIAAKQCYSLETLAVNGQDLIEAGIAKGKNIGIILDKLLDEVIEGKLENNKDGLLNYIYVNKIYQETIDKQKNK